MAEVETREVKRESSPEGHVSEKSSLLKTKDMIDNANETTEMDEEGRLTIHESEEDDGTDSGSAGKCEKPGNLKKPKKSKSCNETFQCDECSRILKSKVTLRKHKLIHLTHAICPTCFRKLKPGVDLKNHVCRNQLHCCKICSRPFKRNYDLKRHMRVHRVKSASSGSVDTQVNEEDEYSNFEGELEECHICGEECPSKLLAKHVESHTNLEVYQCDECDRILKTKKTLKKHKLIHQAHIICPSCFKKLSSREELESHICYKNPNTACEICGAIFKTKNDLRSHMRIHPEVAQTKKRKRDDSLTPEEMKGITSKINKTEECPICGDLCLSKKLKKHVRSHIDVSVFQCDECGRILKTKKILKKHKLIHKTHLICPSCYKKLESDEDFKHHICHARRIVIHTCETCGKSFKSRHDLERHIRSHTKERPFVCKYCAKAFSQKSYCERHIKHNHIEVDRDKPRVTNFICDICWQSFAHKQSLQRHILLHTGERPFVCEICSKGFTQKGHMQNHVKEVHTDCDSRSFKCDLCDKAYKTKRLLLWHQKSHGEPEHFCSICNRGFYTGNACDKHYKTHSKLRPYICDICHRAYACAYSLENHYKNHGKKRSNKNNKINDSPEECEENKNSDS